MFFWYTFLTFGTETNTGLGWDIVTGTDGGGVYTGVASIEGVYIESTPPTLVVVLYSPNVDPVVVGCGIDWVPWYSPNVVFVAKFNPVSNTGLGKQELILKNMYQKREYHK